MMDLRIGDEVASWFNRSFDLVKRFEREGGYRLYPTEVSFVNKARSGERVSVQHNWRNLGWGYCPTNIPQWKAIHASRRYTQPPHSQEQHILHVSY